MMRRCARQLAICQILLGILLLGAKPSPATSAVRNYFSNDAAMIVSASDPSAVFTVDMPEHPGAVGSAYLLLVLHDAENEWEGSVYINDSGPVWFESDVSFANK